MELSGKQRKPSVYGGWLGFAGPTTKAWGCEFGTELFIDPTDDVDLENTTSKKMLWVSK